MNEMVEQVAKAIWVARCEHAMRTAGIELEIWGVDGEIPKANGILEEASAAVEAAAPYQQNYWREQYDKLHAHIEKMRADLTERPHPLAEGEASAVVTDR